MTQLYTSKANNWPIDDRFEVDHHEEASSVDITNDQYVTEPGTVFPPLPGIPIKTTDHSS